MFEPEITQNRSFLKYKNNSIPELPYYAESLDQVEWMFKQLDLRYGSPSIEKPQKNGQHTIRYILKHLALHRESTCLEIAKAERKRNPGSLEKQRNEKFIADDVRKFIQKMMKKTQENQMTKKSLFIIELSKAQKNHLEVHLEF